MLRMTRACALLCLAAYVAPADEARYVGSKLCAGCHPRIFRSFRRTAMGRSMAAAAEAAPGLNAGAVSVAHPKFDRTLRVWAQDGALYQSESQPGSFEVKHQLA